MSRRAARLVLALALLAASGCGADAGGPTAPAPAASTPTPAASAPAPASPSEPLRYVAIGDSYSNGEGLTAGEAWPQKLAAALQTAGPRVSLVLNAARSGWTSEQALAVELPEARAARPDVATVLIGANDAFQDVPVAVFAERLRGLLAGLATMVGDPGRVVVVTIPDYSVAPAVARTPQGQAAGARLAAFNRVVVDEARRARMPLADITALSREMGSDPALVLADGLHPSAVELERWAERIAVVARRAWTGARPAGG